MAQTFYRIQPAGLPLLGHTSEDWVGDPLPRGRVCAYSDVNLVLSGEGDDWFEHEIDGAEMITFQGRDPKWLCSASAGVSVVPVSEISRCPLREWLERAWEMYCSGGPTA